MSVIGMAGASELPWGQKFIKNVVDAHPRIEPIVTGIIMLGFLLLNPKVQALLKKKGIDVSADAAAVAEQKQNLAETHSAVDSARAQAAKAMDEHERKP